MKKLRRTVKKHKETIGENAGLAVALFFIVMLTSQLFSFEQMPKLIADVFSLQEGLGLLIAASLAIAMLLSLPFLLAMPISPLMKNVGKVLSVVVILFWIAVGVQTSVVFVLDQNVGLLGSKIPLMGGIWLVLMMLGLLLILVWHLCRTYFSSKSS
ncbi:MAG TPA: hypothetical protein VGE34_02245 [Candidatus Saccharimonadales bacterium]